VSNIFASKHELRSEYKQKRLLLSQNDSEKYSEIIINQVKNLPVYKEAKMVAIYSPVYQEVDVLKLLEDENKSFCFPKIINFSASLMDFFEPGRKFVLGVYDILEPTGRYVSKSEIDLIIVPGLVFSKEGYRIGYGKGFYDIYLSDFNGVAVGVMYDFQLINSFVYNESDVPLQILVSNTEVICIAQ
jgi:5-formyltetrahydrofolate cyclo-ligase